MCVIFLTSESATGVTVTGMVPHVENAPDGTRSFMAARPSFVATAISLEVHVADVVEATTSVDPCTAAD